MLSNQTKYALLPLTAIFSLLLGCKVVRAQSDLLQGTDEASRAIELDMISSSIADSEFAQLASSDEISEQQTRIRLDLDGDNDEWIVVERRRTENGVVLSAYHTSRVRRDLLSAGATGLVRFGTGELVEEIIDGYDGPVFVPRINIHRWADHETQRIVFIPDDCQADGPVSEAIADMSPEEVQSPESCEISGTDSITVPNGTDLDTGSLMIEYVEKDLVRTVTFQMSQ